VVIDGGHKFAPIEKTKTFRNRILLVLAMFSLGLTNMAIVQPFSDATSTKRMDLISRRVGCSTIESAAPLCCEKNRAKKDYQQHG
jgi:hypothetical protein